ncbi:MAG: ABC transporter substrate-binding protein [Bacteroidota bacterium]
MISVQNLQPLLNGSKGLLFCCLLVFSLASCDSLKKVQKTPGADKGTGKDKTELEEIQGGKVFNPETGQFEDAVDASGQMDTVQWTEVPPETAPPITSDAGNPIDGTRTGGTTEPGNVQSSYNVALLLPFLGNKFIDAANNIDAKSDLALHYYGGTKIAFDDLSTEGVQLNVSVFDTEASEAKTQTLLKRSELAQANMIVGPVRRNNLRLTAAFAKQNGKVLVSPLSPSMQITNDNPYYVQVNPSLKTHCEAITRHVLENHSRDEVVLVCRNKNAEVSRLKYFQEANTAIYGSTAVEKLQEFIITDQSADLNETDISPYIKEGKTTVFIVPSWSNESFVYSLMRKINIAKGLNQVVVYGMPQWMKFERAGLDYFEPLQVHISSASNIDTDDPNVLAFRQRFFERYGMTPSVDAYVGYDVMMYFGRLLAKNGTQLNEVIDREPAYGLHTYFSFSPNAPQSINVENYSEVDYYENKRVNILKFKDFYFQVAN